MRKPSPLEAKIISMRSHYNSSFHQKKVQILWAESFPAQPRSRHQYLGQAKEYFLMSMHFLG